MKDEREIGTKVLSKKKKNTKKQWFYRKQEIKKLLESWHKTLENKTNKNQINKKGNKNINNDFNKYIEY